MLQAVAWALRLTVNTTRTKQAPANLLLNKDMILNEEIAINWDTIKEQRESQAAADSQQENATHKKYHYSEGSKC